MLKNINPFKILFIDIETVPQHEHWDQVDEKVQILWAEKTFYRRSQDDIDAGEFYESNAGIWAEFGKIVCISVGVLSTADTLKVKSFYGHDERQILGDFCELLNTHFYSSQALLCGHNIKEFDVPYIARRLMIHQIELPNLLNLLGKKPWEIPHLDTMELWKFGDYKHFTSLNLLATILDVDTPKDDIDGSQVAEVYYKENNLDRIRKYCEKDVFTVAQVFRRFRQEPLLALDETSHEH